MTGSKFAFHLSISLDGMLSGCIYPSLWVCGFPKGGRHESGHVVKDWYSLRVMCISVQKTQVRSRDLGSMEDKVIIIALWSDQDMGCILASSREGSSVLRINI